MLVSSVVKSPVSLQSSYFNLYCGTSTSTSFSKFERRVKLTRPVLVQSQAVPFVERKIGSQLYPANEEKCSPLQAFAGDRLVERWTWRDKRKRRQQVPQVLLTDTTSHKLFGSGKAEKAFSCVTKLRHGFRPVSAWWTISNAITDQARVKNMVNLRLSRSVYSFEIIRCICIDPSITDSFSRSLQKAYRAYANIPVTN